MRAIFLHVVVDQEFEGQEEEDPFGDMFASQLRQKLAAPTVCMGVGRRLACNLLLTIITANYQPAEDKDPFAEEEEDPFAEVFDDFTENGIESSYFSLARSLSLSLSVCLCRCD
jgi:hypothetical protein